MQEGVGETGVRAGTRKGRHDIWQAGVTRLIYVPTPSRQSRRVPQRVSRGKWNGVEVSPSSKKVMAIYVLTGPALSLRGCLALMGASVLSHEVDVDQRNPRQQRSPIQSKTGS